MELGEVQELISTGQLKLVDTFVTDRVFEEFCRKHGATINMSLMDPSTRKWLISEYGVPDCLEGQLLPRAQKHARIVRTCKCGRKIAGNVYFRHVRHCGAPIAKAPRIMPQVSTSAASNRVIDSFISRQTTCDWAGSE